MKKYFITGLVILMPVALTVMIIAFLFKFFTAPLVPFVTELFLKIEAMYNFELTEALTVFVSRILALILLTLFILVLGMLARWFIIKHTIALAHRLIDRIPIVKTVFNVSRDIFGAIFSTDNKKAFEHPVIIPFPRPPFHAVGFRAGPVAAECQAKVNVPLTTVFLPTAPHPISGFLFLIDASQTHRVDMTNEDAVKFLVSCGIIQPEGKSS
jgi:uncharacterized membrane protein